MDLDAQCRWASVFEGSVCPFSSLEPNSIPCLIFSECHLLICQKAQA